MKKVALCLFFMLGIIAANSSLYAEIYPVKEDCEYNHCNYGNGCSFNAQAKLNCDLSPGTCTQTQCNLGQ